MMLPTDMLALAEARRESIEREMKMLHYAELASRRPSRFRQWAGDGLMWLGVRLVRWGEGMSARNCPAARYVEWVKN